VVLAGVQDPGNVGTILANRIRVRRHRRSNRSLGPQRHRQSIFAKGATRVRRRRAAPSSASRNVAADSSRAIARRQRANGRLQRARSRVPGRGAACCAPAGNIAPLLAPWEVDWCEPVALLVGNEGAGLPDEVERSADARIRIPMSSGIESLNAAAAAAVLFYEAARQRSRHAKGGTL